MKYTIRKNNIVKVAIALLGICSVNLIPNQDRLMLIKVAIVSVSIIPMLIDVFLSKRFLYLIFVGFTFELLAVMSFLLYIVRLEETSWRTLYSNSSMCNSAITCICTSLLIYASVYYLSPISSVKSNTSKITNLNSSTNIVYSSWLSSVYYAVLPFFLVLFVRFSGFFTTRNYASSGGSLWISVYRMLQAVFIFLFFKESGDCRWQNKILKSLDFMIFIVADIAMGLFGYRFILVEVAIFIFMLNISKLEKIKLRYIVVLLLLTPIFYVTLTQIRNGNIAEITLESYFRHERNEFYSLVAIMENKGVGTVNTYLNTLMNLVPGVFASATTDNTGTILLKYIMPSSYISTGMTMGAFYLTEAFFNFGYVGTYIFSVLCAVIFSCLENKFTKGNETFALIYYFTAAQMYSIVYYGSSNYIKIILYFCIFILIYRCVEKQRGGVLEEYLRPCLEYLCTVRLLLLRSANIQCCMYLRREELICK